jgi:hypothetical protein
MGAGINWLAERRLSKKNGFSTDLQYVNLHTTDLKGVGQLAGHIFIQHLTIKNPSVDN